MLTPNLKDIFGDILSEFSLTTADFALELTESAYTGDSEQVISAAKEQMWNRPSLTFVPGIVVMVTVICFNILGDKLRDILDPSLKD